MKTLKISFRTTTPAFIGGANNQENAEFRLASFKGVLRFWWRALQWGNYTNPKELLEAEAKIFGSSDRKVGQSKVRLRLLNSSAAKPIPKDSVLWRDEAIGIRGNESRPGAFYLGYGCVNSFYIRPDPEKNRAEKKAGQLQRPCLAPFEFQIQVVLNLADPTAIESVNQALWVMGHLGGLGAKSRKGFGSLSIMQPDNLVSDWEGVSADDAFRKLSKTCTNRVNWSEDAGWTAFNGHTRIVKVELSNPLGNSANFSRDLLDLIGREMVRFRTWGRGGTTTFGASEKRFWEDHDLFDLKARYGNKPSTLGPVSISHPKRIAFGLPHNYGSKEQYPTKNPLNVPDFADSNDDEGRRASPLFIHIHQPDAERPPVAYLAFFPTQFLPSGVNIKSFGATTPVSPAGLYHPIHQFLDRLEGKTPPPSDPENKIKEELKGTKVL